MKLEDKSLGGEIIESVAKNTAWSKVCKIKIFLSSIHISFKNRIDDKINNKVGIWIGNNSKFKQLSWQ